MCKTQITPRSSATVGIMSTKKSDWVSCNMSILDSVDAYLPRDVGREWVMYDVGFMVLMKGDAVAEGGEPVSVNSLVTIRKV